MKKQNTNLYFIGYFIFMICYLHGNIRNVSSILPMWYTDLLKLASLLLLLLYNVIIFQKWPDRIKVLIPVVLLIAIVVGQHAAGGYAHQLLMMPLLIFGAREIPFWKIIRFAFSVNFLFCVSVISLYFMGFLEDASVSADSREAVMDSFEGVRHSFGYCWPTNLATHIFFIFLLYWMLHKCSLGGGKIMIFIFVSLLLLFYTDSRLGAGCILLIVLANMILTFSKRNPVVAHPRMAKIMIYYVPFLALLSYYATWTYNSADMGWFLINAFLSNRLALGQDALMTVGTPLLGQTYQMSGGDSPAEFYNFLDNTFIQDFVIWGILYTAMFLMAYSYVCYKAYKYKDYVLMTAVMLAGITGIIAHHFSELWMNPLILAIFATHQKFYERLSNNRRREKILISQIE